MKTDAYMNQIHDISTNNESSYNIEKEDYSVADYLVFPKDIKLRDGLCSYLKDNRNTLMHIVIIVVSIFVILRLFDIRLHVMFSESMASIIPRGSIVVTKAIPPMSLRPGDIITFYNEEGISITHRIEEVVSNYMETGITVYVTKGVDNSNVDDHVVRPNQIIGRYVFHIPWIGGLWIQ